MQERSGELDALRGVAILLVVTDHWFGFTPGWAGVDLFFVLSGFLIGGQLMDARGRPGYFCGFYLRRAARILPLYFLSLALLLPHAEATLPLWHYFTFTQNFAYVYSSVWQIDWSGDTWSLCIEEQFYALCPLLIAAIAPKRIPVVCIFLILRAPVCRIAALTVTGSGNAVYALPFCRMDALAAGVIAAWAVRHGRVPRALPAAGMVVGGIALFALICACYGALNFGGWMLLVGFGALAVAGCNLMFLANCGAIPTPGPLRWMGIGAYSIYLFHGPMPGVVGSPWVAIPIMALIAVASWHLIEKPAMRWARHGRSVRPRWSGLG